MAGSSVWVCMGMFIYMDMGMFSFVSNSQNVFPSGCIYIQPLSIVPQ